jgi:predicted dehydrogenase
VSTETIRWGVMSTANIGRAAVVPAIAASRSGRVEAVASRDVERARVFAGAHGIARWHGRYQDLVDDPEVDAVYVPLPNSLHREWTLRALRAGKHVLCEKPLALTEDQCLEMDAAAREAGVTLMEAFMYRFHPRTEQVASMVRGGALGTVRAIRSTFTFRLTRPGNIRMDPGLGGGALMDVGCYCVNVSRTLAGAEPVAVQAQANWAESGVDAEMAGILRFPDGLLAHFDCALTTERAESFEVAGEAGFLRVPSAFLPGTADAAIEEHRGRGERTDHVVPGADEYVRMVEHFADCVRTGAAPRYGAREAALNMRTIEALYRSARAGGAVVTLPGVGG